MIPIMLCSCFHWSTACANKLLSRSCNRPLLKNKTPLWWKCLTTFQMQSCSWVNWRLSHKSISLNRKLLQILHLTWVIVTSSQIIYLISNSQQSKIRVILLRQNAYYFKSGIWNSLKVKLWPISLPSFKEKINQKIRISSHMISTNLF